MMQRIGLAILTLPFWFFLRRVYRDRIGAFGCFDDCFNIVAGYFIGQGKLLYTNIFFNHQPIPAFISFFIQKIYQPQSVYELIYRHRMTLIGYFAFADIILILRFGIPGFAFALLFETTKGYVFGERFLAESIIVYPLVYLFGLAWESLGKKRITMFELTIASVLAWFVLFSREPYIPLTLIIYLTVCMCNWPRSRFPLFLLLLGSFLTLFAFDVKSYWWNVVTVNLATIAGSEIQTLGQNGFGIFSIFLYPFQTFVSGTWNHFRQIEVVLSAIIIISVIIFILRPKLRKYAIFLVLTLGFANIRQVTPGTIYYVAFHHMIWYAFAIVSVGFLLNTMQQSYRLFALVGWIVYGCIVLYTLITPDSYLREIVDRTAQFGVGYGHYITQGEIIRRLSDPTHTLFLEEWDDLIYWQAKRPSAYPYSWYTSVMHVFPQYRRARDIMFAEHPPDFYYGQCDEKSQTNSLPENRKYDYVQLTQNGKLMCLFVKDDLAVNISDERWVSVRDFSVDDPRVSIYDASIQQ